MEKYKLSELEALSKLNFNSYCFDCGRRPANFASISDGIFLCFKCSGEHMGYSPKIKSITLNEWKPEEVKYMVLGGNLNLIKFFNRNKVRPKMKKEDIFKSKLLGYYRRKLEAQVLELEFNEKEPSESEKFQKDIGPLKSYKDYKETTTNYLKGLVGFDLNEEDEIDDSKGEELRRQMFAGNDFEQNSSLLRLVRREKEKEFFKGLDDFKEEEKKENPLLKENQNYLSKIYNGISYIGSGIKSAAFYLYSYTFRRNQVTDQNLNSNYDEHLMHNEEENN